jgi:flagella basal body P-ring formation protein FlgA
MAVETILATWLILAAAAPAAGAAGAAPAQAEPSASCGEQAGVRIYLPRTQQVQGSTISIGEVCIVRGSDDARTALAEKVQLGRAPFSREEMKVDRAMILGRLAASGFSKREIHFCGANEVLVTPNEQEIDASRLVAAASALLNEKMPCKGEAQWRLARQVEPVSVPSGQAVKLSPVLLGGATEQRAAVRVDVTRDGSAAASCELGFEKVHLWRQAVARKDISPGQTITESNVAVETVLRHSPQEAWTSPYGRHTSRAVAAGSVLDQGLLTTPKPELVFERNALVRIRVDLGDFSLLAKGVALAPGRVGETVPVQNIDSKRILTARVCPDGTVIPLLEESVK